MDGLVWYAFLRATLFSQTDEWAFSAFLDRAELDAIRRNSVDDDDDNYYQDQNIEEGKFQTLTMTFHSDDGVDNWPMLFEEHLHSLKPASEPKTRAQQRAGEQVSGNRTAFSFSGEGNDGEE